MGREDSYASHSLSLYRSIFSPQNPPSYTFTVPTFRVSTLTEMMEEIPFRAFASYEWLYRVVRVVSSTSGCNLFRVSSANTCRLKLPKSAIVNVKRQLCVSSSIFSFTIFLPLSLSLLVIQIISPCCSLRREITSGLKSYNNVECFSSTPPAISLASRQPAG